MIRMRDVIYWPCAVLRDGERLFTTEGVRTLKRALQQFEIWEEHYKYHNIREAWIDQSDGKRIILRKKWVIDQECYAQPEGSRWMVLMIKSGTGERAEFFEDYDESLKYAFAAKEDCEAVSVYERDADGWRKGFNV